MNVDEKLNGFDTTLYYQALMPTTTRTLLFHFFLATCVTLSWSLSFWVHVNLFFRIVS